ncbi:MAG: hypothetical protein NTV44_00565 [Firmicutes bacterium]|nr:hypothetical protein [Bacillota bacterium]
MNAQPQKLYSPLSFKEKCARLLARFILPFKRFSETFKMSDFKGRIALISSLILPGLGDIILGEFEIGVSYFVMGVAYYLYLFSVGWKHFLGIIRLDYVNLLSVAIILTILFLLIYYLSLESIEKKAVLRSSGKKLHGSYILKFIVFIGKKKIDFLNENLSLK